MRSHVIVPRATLERNAYLLEEIFTDLFGNSPKFHRLLPEQTHDPRRRIDRPPPPPMLLMRSR